MRSGFNNLFLSASAILPITLADFKVEIIYEEKIINNRLHPSYSYYMYFLQQNIQKNSFSTEKTAYYIVHSDMLNKSGGLVGIDIDGNITSQESLKIQDISKSDLVDNTFIAGGNRANNHLLIDTQGNVTEFNLLDNPNYSGVTTITINNENIVAVMNGNITDNTYQNLFVIQDIQGNILEKKIFDIFASDILCENNTVYIIGSYLNLEKDQWSGKIIKYNLADSTIKENITSPNRDYKEVVLYDGNLYCSVADMNGYIKEIDILDMDSLEKLTSMNFDKNISSIFSFNNFLYGVFDNIICKIESDSTIVELSSLPQNTYVSSSLINENHVYFFSRNEATENKNGYVNLGFIVDYDILNNQMKSTPLSIENKNYDSIIFFPVIENHN